MQSLILNLFYKPFIAISSSEIFQKIFNWLFQTVGSSEFVIEMSYIANTIGIGGSNTDTSLQHYKLYALIITALIFITITIIVICTATILTGLLGSIVLLKQHKTQKMLRELNEKLDKLQPPSDPDELNTEDTESAE